MHTFSWLWGLRPSASPPSERACCWIYHNKQHHRSVHCIHNDHIIMCHHHDNQDHCGIPSPHSLWSNHHWSPWSWSCMITFKKTFVVVTSVPTTTIITIIMIGHHHHVQTSVPNTCWEPSQNRSEFEILIQEIVLDQLHLNIDAMNRFL